MISSSGSSSSSSGRMVDPDGSLTPYLFLVALDPAPVIFPSPSPACFPVLRGGERAVAVL